MSKISNPQYDSLIVPLGLLCVLCGIVSVVLIVFAMFSGFSTMEGTLRSIYLLLLSSAFWRLAKFCFDFTGYIVNGKR